MQLNVFYYQMSQLISSQNLAYYNFLLTHLECASKAMAKILVASISNRLIQWVSPFTSFQTGGGALAILESGILVLGFSGSGSFVLEFLEAEFLASGSGILVSGLLFCEKMVLDLLGHHCF